jgi:hypothetical protein
VLVGHEKFSIPFSQEAPIIFISPFIKVSLERDATREDCLSNKKVLLVL